MDMLTLVEFASLSSVVELGDGAYGMPIKEKVAEKLNRPAISTGQLYTTLARLERQGYLISYTGGATSTRGGRSKRFFKLTSSGLSELARSSALISNNFSLAPNF